MGIELRQESLQPPFNALEEIRKLADELPGKREVMGSHISRRAVIEINRVKGDKNMSLLYIKRVYDSLSYEDKDAHESNYSFREKQIEESHETNASSREQTLRAFLSLLYENRTPYQEVEGEENSVPRNEEGTEKKEE